MISEFGGAHGVAHEHGARHGADAAGVGRDLSGNGLHAREVHIADEAEAKPKLSGDVLLYDCETGDEREVTVTAKVLERFETAYRAYLEDIDRFCTSKQVPYIRADVNVPFDELILRVFRRGGFLR